MLFSLEEIENARQAQTKNMHDAFLELWGDRPKTHESGYFHALMWFIEGTKWQLDLEFIGLKKILNIKGVE